MKKQRILALTLAATTALSMFGGISASAAQYPDAYKAPVDNTATAATQGAWETNAAKIVLGTPAGDEAADVDFLIDYAVKDANKVADAEDTLVKYVKGGDGAPDASALNAAMDAAYTAGAYDSQNDTTLISATRKAALEEFEAVLKSAKELKDNKGYYDADELTAWNADALITRITGFEKTYNTFKNSKLIIEAKAAKSVLDNLVANSSAAEIYSKKLDELMKRTAEDYTAENFITFNRHIEDAERYAADGKYAKAMKSLELAEGVRTVTPNTKAMEATLKSLFVDGNILATYAGDDEDVHVYLEKDYTTSRLQYAWKDFVKVYGETKAVYDRANDYFTKRTTPQSLVDEALANLEAAITALDPNYTTSDWVIVYLENQLAKANNIVESDYRTNTKYYKDFLAAKAEVEKLLEAPAVKDAVANAKGKALEDAIKNLQKVRIAVPSSLKTELKNLVKEADTMLKKDKTVTFAQAVALDAAIEKAAEAQKADLISAYESAIKGLNDAIAGFTQKQGWYQETKDGPWYYGKGNTVVANDWLNLQGTWYYFNADGTMVSNAWRQINGQWYYFFESGKMVAGQWHKIGNEWFSFDGNGHMRTGWYKNPYNNNWFYLLKKGEGKEGLMVANKWMKINGKDYYFGKDGAMAVNTVINGYKVGADGAWVK